MKPLSWVCACLMVAATADAQNLLTNGSFNGNLNGWTLYGEGEITFDAGHDATGTPGSGSAKLLAPVGGGGTEMWECVSVTGSTAYRAGAKILIPSGQATTGYVAVAVNWYAAPWCQTSLANIQIAHVATTGGAWVTGDTGFVTSPANAQGAQIYANTVNQSAAGAGMFQANFDDFYLIPRAPAFSRWIPAVIHKDVPSKNAKWRSDVAILNRSSNTANLTLTMHPTAGPVSQTVQLAGSSQLLQTDVAGWLGVTADSGSLEVASDQDFFLSGRTYNQVDATHTYGQDYKGQAPSELLGAEQSAWLPQLTENALYRTNIGITNTGTATANVTMTIYDGSGNQVWTDSRDYTAGGFYKYQQPYLAYGGITNGYAKVAVNTGSGVVAYASVVDANTGDPTTITMKW